MEATLNVKAVSQLTGLNQHTLRAWERRYGAVKPERSPTGRRFYSEDDVDRLILFRQLLDRGLAIGSFARLSKLELSDLLSQNQGMARQVALQSLVSGNAQTLTPILAAIEAALHDYDLVRVYQEIQEARFKCSAREFVVDLIAPLMAYVGRMIVTDRLSIAQEHALSAIVKSHLADILFTMSDARSGRRQPRRIALATMEGDLHEIGILISAVLCAHHGFAVQYIGPNMPPGPLAVALKAMSTDLVILGMTPLPPEMVRWTPAAYVAELCRDLPKHHLVWLGGPAEQPLKLPIAARRWLHMTSFAQLDEALAAGAGGGKR